MNEEDSIAVQNISALLVDTLVNNTDGENALQCAAALGVTLAALAKNAKEQNDLVFAFGVDVAIKIYEKHREN